MLRRHFSRSVMTNKACHCKSSVSMFLGNSDLMNHIIELLWKYLMLSITNMIKLHFLKSFEMKPRICFLNLNELQDEKEWYNFLRLRKRLESPKMVEKISLKKIKTTWRQLSGIHRNVSTFFIFEQNLGLHIQCLKIL